MILKKVSGLLPTLELRQRGLEMQRIESLSDAVFAFSVSLLVASLEVPQTFGELRIILQGAIPFFATVAMIFLFWYQQYRFFRNYGLNDLTTILLNLVFLGVILFYVYPLKFLFSLLLSSWTGINLFPTAAERGIPVILQQESYQLIIFFSFGYCLIWLLLFLMHQRVMVFKKKLELNPYEILYTAKEKRGAIWNVFVGFAAILLASAGLELLSGIIYLLIPFLLILNNRLFKQRIKLLKN